MTLPTDEEPMEIELLDVAPARNPNRGDDGDGVDVVHRHRARVIRQGSRADIALRVGLPILVAVVLMAVVFLLPVIEGRLLTRVVAFTVILWGLDVQLGLGGQLSLGHGAFVGAGAYTAAVMMGTHNWPFIPALLAAAVIGFLVGILVGLPSLRIQGQYLAMITLGFAVAFPYFIRRFSWFTGGLNGPAVRYEFVPPAWMGLKTPDYHLWTHLIVCVIALGMYAVVRRIVKGPFGRQIRAVADNPSSATAFGLRIGWIRVLTVALSGAVAAVGGALLVFETPAVSADTYNALFSLSLYAAAVFGGIGTLVGSFLGAMLIIASPWLVSKLGLKIDPELIGGVVLVVFTLVARDGVVGLLRPWFRGWVDVEDTDLADAHRAATARSSSPTP